MKIVRRVLLRASLILLVVAVLFFVVANLAVYASGRGAVDDIALIKPRTAAIVFGAKVYENGELSPMLADRVQTAIDLYQLGKVKKLLLTGDHGRVGYDEVNAMKGYALARQVDEEDIFTDHAGFSTYESIYRAREVFRVKKAVLVTQKFHLRRTLYIARSAGLDVQGLIADKREYNISNSTSSFREYFANLKAFWEVTTGKNPTFLGPAIPITGDGRKSRG
ncbi:MAG TPA: hypothetical protein ENI11_03555 [Actinobacteria bacterium]|nr:hypothetical protein [Actinomycetota bacterium]